MKPIVGEYIRHPDGGLERNTNPTGVITYHLTDMGNAQRLVHLYGEDIRYCHEAKRWLIWNGKVWEWDMGAKINVYAKMTARYIYHEAGDEPSEKARKELADHAKRTESDHRLNAMIALAQSEFGVPVRLAELDVDPWLFNCENGTIDLRTGVLRPHSRKDLITVLSPVEYDSDAECPLWLAFLRRITGGDEEGEELAYYLQRAIGYSLSGDTSAQVMFLLYGLGCNGKSTFTMTIRKLMAGYAERMDAEDLMLKDKRIAGGGGPKEGIANLRNKRFVVGSELQDGRRLDVGLIKDMTGGETIKGRRLYEHEFEFMPSHKLWLYGNHKPVIADSTLSIWRRVKQIPFNVTIPSSEVDMALGLKLEEELPGILAWAVEGCLEWQKNGLYGEPAAVTIATEKYQHDQDILGDFLEDCCVVEPLGTIAKSDLKEEYHKWCQDNGMEPVTQKTFKNRLTEKGIGEGRVGRARYWKGLRARTEADGDISGDNSDKSFGQLATKVTGVTAVVGKVPYKENQKNLHAKPVPHVTSVTKDDKTPAEYPITPCYCGGTAFWLNRGHEWICARCHPPPPGVDSM